MKWGTSEMPSDEWIEERDENKVYLGADLCPQCGSGRIVREDYLNPCQFAACRLNGPVTYHLGCGSQWREYCADCGALLYDSADDEIKNTEWETVEYCCSQCREGIQPGHWACGQTFSIPKERS